MRSNRDDYLKYIDCAFCSAEKYMEGNSHDLELILHEHDADVARILVNKFENVNTA